MPLDDLNWSPVRDDVRQVRRHRRRVDPLHVLFRLLVGLGYLFILYAVVLAVVVLSDMMYPDAGLSVRLLYGNFVANRNMIALGVLDDSPRLKFEVAGVEYTVISPHSVITPDERQAVLGYAAWKQWPIYSVDGPLVVDP
jgi:hypothetical protein